MRNTQAIQPMFELSRPGRRAAVLPKCDVPVRPLDELLPRGSAAATPPALPELSEPDVVRHFTNLSTLNM
ncbi:MAG TPA: aminomethyl-transferring glycine dehydrogenase subunit GcvPB, partial [Pirellulales bacterium]|nr:aminomethyl-transferring glycine dehydrogenase subunit GcvPB [Pirellulales bacterium]